MRYYDYLSTAKVDMLYGQLSGAAKPRGREVGIDLKVIKFSQKTDPQQQEPNIYEKLDKVEEWIYANEPVGNVDNPQPWIYGRTPLRTVTVESPADLGEPGAIFYAAMSEIGSIILAGSAIHRTPAEIGMIKGQALKTFSRLTGINQLLRSSEFPWDPDFPKYQQPSGWRQDSIDRYASEALWALMQEGQDIGECEFLAKSLGRVESEVFDPDAPAGIWRASRSTIIIATPLFVALDD